MSKMRGISTTAIVAIIALLVVVAGVAWYLTIPPAPTKPPISSWQPFADFRLRMAAACAINMTYANIYVNNRLSVLANNIIPPGTAPEGSYNPDVKPIFSFNLTKAAELIRDAYEHPLTSATHEMHYYDGTVIPPGVVNNSFSPTNPKYIEFYVQSGADTFIRIFTTMADNLNAISRRAYGLMWRVVIVPGGQQYTLASRHQIDSYIGGWIADYNHVIDWLIPMYLSSGTYFSWNRWNLEVLDELCDEAVEADKAGDITRLLEINDEMNRIANEQLVYMVWWHDTEYYTRSSWLKGWYMNPVYGVDLWSSMYYETQATPKPKFVDENKLVYESGATYQWMDPHVSYYQYDYWTLWHSVETLVWNRRESPTEIIPWLAESYTQINSTTYEFKLRRNIKFQDGTPFNATAVWFSLNRLLVIDGTSGDPVYPVPGSQAAWMAQQLLDVSLSAALSGEDQAYDAAWVQAVLDQNFVEIVDDYTVRIHIQTPTTQFLPILAGPWAGIVSPSSTIAGDYEHGGWGTWDGNYVTYFEHRAGNGDTAFNVPEHGWKIGTGAYYVESVNPTTYKIVLKAFDDYWGGPDKINLPPEGKQRIETIEFVYQPSFSTRLLDLKAGTATGIGVPEVEIFSVVDRDQWVNEGKLVSIIDGVTVYGVFPTFNTWWLSFNTNVTRPG